MAFYKQDIVDINLNTGNIHRSFLNHAIGYKNDDADRFGIRTFRDGVPQDLTGASCQAVFMAPNGSKIALTSYGTVSGNVAYVTLPPACYDYEGQFCLAIQLVGGGVTGTMRIVDGMVVNTGASGTVAPTSSVPTYQEIIAQYDAMVAATAAANGAIAATYSGSATYKVGDYCIHDGGLYRCTTAIATAEAWNAAHWTAVKLGNDVSDLKSAINGVAYDESIPEVYIWENGAINAGVDVSGTNSKRLRTVGYYLTENATINVDSGWRAVVYYYDNSKTYKTYADWATGTIKLNDTYKYYRLMFSNSNGNLDVSVADGSHLQTAITLSFIHEIKQNTGNTLGLFDVMYDYSAGTVTAIVDRDFDSPAYDLTMTDGVLRGTRNSVETAHPILLNDYVKKCQFNRGNPESIVVAYNNKTNTGLELNLTNGNFLWYNFNNTTYGLIKNFTLTNTVGGNGLVKCDHDGETLTITTTNKALVVAISGEDLQGYAVRYGWESGQSGSNFNASNVQFVKPFYYEQSPVDLSGKLINRMKDKKVFFIGDSITNAGHGTEAWRWQNQIENDLGITASNYGVSQTCMTATSASDTDAICKRYAEMASGADYVFCMAGINDFGTSKPLGELSSTDITDFSGALKTFIEGVYNKYMASTNYQFKLYYACPYHVTDYFQSETNSLGLTQIDYVNRAKEICAMYGVPFLNMYESSGFNKINEAYLLYDHLHPGQTGNTLLANVIGLFLSTH